MARIRLLAYTILDGTLIPIDRAGADLQLAAAGRRPEPGVARLAVDRVEGRPVLEVVVRGVFEPQHGRAEHLHPQMPGPDRLSFDIGPAWGGQRPPRRGHQPQKHGGKHGEPADRHDAPSIA
jgi:hypothetical protein